MSTGKPSFLDVLKSVIASFFGVQSEKNRKRDFEKGDPSQFILVGLVLTILFIFMMFGIVKLVLLYAT